MIYDLGPGFVVKIHVASRFQCNMSILSPEYFTKENKENVQDTDLLFIKIDEVVV